MEQKDFIVDRYSHYFSVLPITAMARKAVVDFMTTLIEHQLTKKRGKWSMEPSCVYAAKDYARGRYHLHINCYDEFILFLENYRITEADLTVTQHGLYEPVKVDITVTKEGFVPYETQLPIIDHCLTVGPQAAVTSQPGSGKTAMLQFVAAQMGVRMAVRSLGGYAGRWAEAWKDYHGWEEKKDFLLCCGAKALRKLIKEMREGKWTELKAIYISNGAVRDLIKDKDTPKHDLECGGMFDVGKLYEELGVGLLGVDEAHKEMHSNFIADLYTNVPVRICLTATLIPRDNFTAKIYEMYLPERLRKDMGALRVYVDVIEVMYNLKHPRKFDRVIKQTVYSHNEFERYLMKDKETLERYMDAFYNYVIRTWLSERVYETKAVFFCGLVDMGAALCAYFKRRLPDIRVAQFNAGDDYDVLDINDLIFTTALKAGTAVDIQDLSRIYNAISIDAPNTLVQIVGRLRYREHLVKEGFHFHQFVCIDIPKQMAYQKNRRQLLRPRVKSIREVPLGALI